MHSTLETLSSIEKTLMPLLRDTRNRCTALQALLAKLKIPQMFDHRTKVILLEAIQYFIEAGQTYENLCNTAQNFSAKANYKKYPVNFGELIQSISEVCDKVNLDMKYEAYTSACLSNKQISHLTQQDTINNVVLDDIFLDGQHKRVLLSLNEAIRMINLTIDSWSSFKIF